MDFSQLYDRMIRAAKLEVDLYEEVEDDTSANNQAVLVVILASLAGGLGSIGQGGFEGLLIGTIVSLVGWVIWAFLTLMIGTKLLPVERTESGMGEMLRTIGFSSAPGMVNVLALFPVIGSIIRFGVSIWMLAAMVVAVRQALDYESTGRAIGVCLIGWFIQAAIIGSVMVMSPS